MTEQFRHDLREARDERGVDVEKVCDEETGRMSRQTRNLIAILLCLSAGGTPLLFAVLKWHAALQGVALDLNESALYWAYAGGITGFVAYITGKKVINKIPQITKRNEKQ